MFGVLRAPQFFIGRMIFIKRSTILKIVSIAALLAGGIISLILAINEKIPEEFFSSHSGELVSGPNPIFGYLLYFGDGSILMLIAAIPALFGDSDFKRTKAFFLAVTTILGCFLSEGLRTLFGTLAPASSGITSAIGISMPCPAVMNSTVFALALSILIYRYMKKSPGKRLALAAPFLLPVLTLVGAYFSGFFDITDITAALCFGGVLPIIMSIAAPMSLAESGSTKGEN